MRIADPHGIRTGRCWFLPPDYPAGLGREPEDAASGEGVHVGPGRYSLVNLEDAWELRTMLSIEHPGIEAQYRPGEGGAAIARLRHADGSWATAAGCPARSRSCGRAVRGGCGTWSTD